MAGIMEDVYNFIQAPANARKAREAFKSDTMATAPTYRDVLGMKVDDRLAPTTGNPAALMAIPQAQSSGIGAKIGTQMFGPPIGGNVASSMDLAAMEKLAGPAPAKGTPAYASWLAAGRAAWFNAMNGGLPPNFPVDSDIPLNSQNVPTLEQSAAGKRIGSGGARIQIPGTTLFGSHTGNRYNMGQSYALPTGGIFKATPSGFVKTGKVSDGVSSAERYAASVSNTNHGAGGYTSSGESRTTPSGESWAANFGS